MSHVNALNKIIWLRLSCKALSNHQCKINLCSRPLGHIGKRKGKGELKTDGEKQKMKKKKRS